MTPNTPLSLLTQARAKGVPLIIGLPNGRSCPIGTYVKAWRKLKELPPETLCPGWGFFPMTAKDILREISKGVDDRINRHAPPPKETIDDDTFWQLRRLANILNGTRVVVGKSEVPPEYRARLAHRIRDE